MSRAMKIKAGLATAAFCGMTVAIVDCSHRGSGVGDLQLDLKVSTSSEIKSIDYQISGNGITPLTGAFDVSKFAVVNGVVAGLRAGKGYSVELTGTSTDGAVTCTGDTKVDVLEGKTVQANIILQCSDTKGRGLVSITGTFDNCPVVAVYSATPMSVPLLGAIMLQARGVDLDGDPLMFKWDQSPEIGTLAKIDQAEKSLTANTTFICTSKAGTTKLTVTVSDGTCSDSAEITVSCGLDGTGGASGSGTGNTTGSGTGNVFGGSGGTSGGGLTMGSGSGSTSGSGGMPAMGGANGTGPMMGMGGMAAGGGMTGVGGGIGAGGAAGCGATHCGRADCDACTFGPTTLPGCAGNAEGCANCLSPVAEDCDKLTDAGDQRLCQNVYACFVAHASECVHSGDPLGCWCGSNPTTCTTANSPPTQANGPCLAQVFAAAKSQDAPTIFGLLSTSDNPLGRATNLLLCRGTFCPMSCSVP